MIKAVSGSVACSVGSCIKLDHVRAIRELWQECGQFPALEADEAMIFFLNGMGKLVGAQSGYWAGAAKEEKMLRKSNGAGLFEGFEAVDYLAMRGEVKVEDVRRLECDYYKMVRRRGLCPLAQAAVEGRGSVRGLTRREVIEDAAWEEHWLRSEFYQPNGIEDRLFVIFPVDSDAESVVVFDRRECSEPFGEQEKEMLLLAVCGIGQLHRELMLSRGGVMNVEKLLTPREIDVLKQLLTGDTEKEIADSLTMGKSTLHHHVLAIYRKFGVRNRAGLHALWGRT